MTTLAEVLNLALDHHRSGRLAEAAALYVRVLEIEPEHAATLYYLGYMAQQQRRFDEAEALFRRSIAASALEPATYLSLGEALRAQGKLDEAAAAYREALRLDPGYAVAHANLAVALAARGEIAPAEAAYREALRLRPDVAETYNNLGVLLREQRRLGEAHDCFVTAVRLKANFVEAQNNLGNVLRDQGQLQGAIEAYRRALAIRGDYGPAQFNLGNSLRRAGDLPGALEAFRHAVAIDPRDAKAFANLGAVHAGLNQFDAAVEACRRAIAIEPGFALAHNNLASSLQSRGEIEEAIGHYRRAAQLNPDDRLLQSNLAHALLYAPGVDPQTIFDAHLRWASRHADPLTPAAPARPIDRTPSRRLRIGYVSAYFREHAISVFSEPLLAAHDHREFEITCYSDVTAPDAATRRFQSCADRWTPTAGLDDAALAERIAADRIDILVDLTGHLDHNRLLAFARRPAPIQVTYLGYQSTTGMRAMGYRLTDAWSDPPGATDRYYTETLVRLPRTFFCYRPLDGSPDVGALRALARGHVTFGSFNKLAKLTREVVACWAQILLGVEGSRLVILAGGSDETLQRLRADFERHGVSAARVEFAGRRPRREYLLLHHEVDIALDSFPFNGHTTVCEALWMGVPVVALAGATNVSRFGASALVNLGLGDLVATTIDQYVNSAVRLAGDLTRLGQLRGGLRAMMSASCLMDAPEFARGLEAAYRQMWHRFCER